MCHIHSIIPPYITRAIIESPHVEEHIKQIHRYTLERNANIREVLLNIPGPAHPSFVPPDVHRHLEMNNELSEELRGAATRTLQHDAQFRRADPHSLASEYSLSVGAAASTPRPHRTVYDFQHGTDARQLPGTVVVIDEGGELVPVNVDPTEAANEAYKNIKLTWDFYYQLFQRNSIDGNGLKLTATVHYGTKYQNAFWFRDQMVFGDGDGAIFTQFAGLLDVVGHELTHGVITSTSNLVYANQSGALNESLADVFGIQIKQWRDNQTDPKTANWVIGAGIWAEGINGRGLRDMAAPGTAFDDPRVGKDRQPATMADYSTAPSEDDGVHTNSGIPNHAFYLAAVKIGKASWEGAGPIWYRAMVDETLRPNATFEDFARLTVKHADPYIDQVTAAWSEVCVAV